MLLIVNLFLNQNLTFLLYVKQTWMTQLILAFFLWGVIFLHSKRILLIICMTSQFMWKKDFLLTGTYLKKTLLILTYVFDWLYFTLCLTSSSSTDHLFHLDPQFNSISSNIDEVLSINSSANVFVSGDFNVYHKDWFWQKW